MKPITRKQVHRNFWPEKFAIIMPLPQVGMVDMNEGLMIHPMPLHGMPQTVISKDGYYLPQPYKVDTLNIAPGERYDVLFTARKAGNLAFHCRILSHGETRQGLFGMVTPSVISEE